MDKFELSVEKLRLELERFKVKILSSADFNTNNSKLIRFYFDNNEKNIHVIELIVKEDDLLFDEDIKKVANKIVLSFLYKGLNNN